MKKPICPNCKSKNILYMKKKAAYWCRVCGKEWKKK